MENNNLIYKKLLTTEGDAELEISIKEYFPDLPNQISELIQTDAVAKQEVTKWLHDEVMGAQFNSVRLCCIPKEEDKFPGSFNDELCESYKICPLFRNNLAPNGNLCPIEKFKVTKLTNELVSELEVDIFSDYTDKYIIGELVTYSMIEDRAVRALGALSLGLTSITMGRSSKTYTKAKSYLIDVINDMKKAKADSRKTLLATREEKLKVKMAKSVTNNKSKVSKVIDIIQNKEKTTNGGLLFDPEEAEVIVDGAE